VPCWSDCFAGGAVVETGGCVVAHGRRLPAAATVSNGGATVFQWFPFYPLGFVFKKTSLPGFKLPLTLSFLSLFHFSLWLVLSSLRFVLFSPVFSFFFSTFFLFVLPTSFFFSPLSPRVLALWWSIYRAKGSGGIPIATL